MSKIEVTKCLQSLKLGNGVGSRELRAGCVARYISLCMGAFDMRSLL